MTIDDQCQGGSRLKGYDLEVCTNSKGICPYRSTYTIKIRTTTWKTENYYICRTFPEPKQ